MPVPAVVMVVNVGLGYVPVRSPPALPLGVVEIVAGAHCVPLNCKT